MKARMAALVTLLCLAGIGSVAVHEAAHCMGAGHAPWSCTYTVHYHGGFGHVAHSSHYTPGDHAWIVPAQLAFLAAACAALVFLLRPRPTTV